MQVSSISGGQYQLPNYNQNLIKNSKFDIYNQRYPNGITLSFTVNAYIEQKINICERFKNICKKKDELVYSTVDPRLNNFYRQPQFNQVQQNQQGDNRTKQILNNGK